ncbi:hypothetical protein MtrunA17_Chr6g0459161 [Medicago truncatula]|uniref:Uncharacterized protein n=1 Tax=Medicago truncatula TaxID=3880 RepID=A0A396HDB2_MEDTR|nr:hypothetical protein MtrunA17_Chr6g0459161 [Medicago truncatula]
MNRNGEFHRSVSRWYEDERCRRRSLIDLGFVRSMVREDPWR